jgi:hypothetical protein
MATLPFQQFRQGVLDVANPLVFTAPNKYQCTVAFSFNNPAAYDITVNIVRNSPASTIQLYSLSLDPGDTVETSPYGLFQYDRIEVSTTTAGTTYTMSIGNTLAQ